MGWLHRLAGATVLATLLLLAAGALVTSTDSGMAFPDWPSSAGRNLFAYPWFRATRAEFIEHGHRLMGAFVGVLTLALAFGLWFKSPRRDPKLLGLLASAVVLAQGILGGCRVLFDAKTFAFLHACLAYPFFALLCGLWGVTGPESCLRGPRALARAATLMIYLQIVTGAALRQLHFPLALHMVLALLVTVLVCRLGYLLVQGPAFRIGVTLAALILFQVSLGAASYLSLEVVHKPLSAVLHTVLHVVTGAILLGTATLAALRLKQEPA